MYKVVFHITENNKWGMVLNNIRNLKQSDLELDIAVIAVGESVLGYSKDSNFAKNISEVKDLGVNFIICNRAMNGFKLAEENLIEGVDIVPSGTVEIVLKQADGYSYIRP